VLQPADSPAGGPARWCLRVSDTGVGLPADFEERRGQSLGLQLAADLAGQIGGALIIEPGPGAAFSVTFQVEAT
jgi:two-component sensor histidine kinase